MAGNFFTKAIGLAALGLAGYDTIATSNQLAPKYARKLRVNQINDMYMRTMTSEAPGVLDSMLHKSVRNWSLDNNLFSHGQKIKSHIICFTKKFADNCVNIGLGALALFAGNGKFSVLKIPYLDKVAAILLTLKAGHVILKNLFGFGEPDYRKNVL